MTGWAQLYQAGFVTGENGVAWVPRTGGRGRPGILVCHGADNTAQSSWASTVNWRSNRICQSLATRGFVLLASDFGGPNTFGNDLSMTRMSAARTWLTAQGCAPDEVMLLGASMGGLMALNYASRNPTAVKAVVGIEPLINLDEIRNGDTLGLRDEIDTAWGVTYPAALPARASIHQSANYQPLIDYKIPVQLHYSTGDVTVSASSITTFGASVGAELHRVSTSLPHGDALMGAADLTVIGEFFERHAG